MIKTFEKYYKIDPYNEEIWPDEEKIDFLMSPGTIYKIYNIRAWKKFVILCNANHVCWIDGEIVKNEHFIYCPMLIIFKREKKITRSWDENTVRDNYPRTKIINFTMKFFMSLR